MTRILVVRLGSLGDVIHALPAVASLKHSFPGSHLTWAIESRWACLLEQNPYVDRVLEIARSSAAGLVSAFRSLRAVRFDLAIDFQGLMKSALLASLARADRIFGFHRSQVREKPAGLCYSDSVLSPSAHVVERNLDLAAAAGAGSLLRTFPLPPGSPEGSLPDAFVLASPLAGWGAKQWPLEYYDRLAALLKEEAGLPLVLNGPPEAAAALSQASHAAPHVSGIAGLIFATRAAVAVAGVDSGPLHLAAALGKAGVAIYGPTDPARNGPAGGSFQVLRAAGASTTYERKAGIDGSMRAITPEMALAALKPHLVGRAWRAGQT